MSEYPIISNGLGKLTPGLWTRLMRMLQDYESNKTASQSNQPGTKKPYFLAKITASTAIGGTSNRYNYTWTEVVLDNASGFAVRANGLSGTTALNICEMSNTATDVGPGVAVDADDYPDGFDMTAIGKAGDGGSIEVVVMMYHVKDADGNLRAVFSMANAHDGSCS